MNRQQLLEKIDSIWKKMGNPDKGCFVLLVRVMSDEDIHLDDEEDGLVVMSVPHSILDNPVGLAVDRDYPEYTFIPFMFADLWKKL